MTYDYVIPASNSSWLGSDTSCQQPVEPKDMRLSLSLLRAQMRRDGFLHQSIVSPATIENIRKHVLSVLSNFRGEDFGLHSNPKHIRQLPTTDEENQILIGILKHPEIIGLPYQDGLRELMSTLVGDDVFVHPRKYLRVIYPEAGSPSSKTGIHQDVTGLNSTADTFTLWIPIANCSRVHGGLRVLQGSHRFGILKLKHPTSKSIELEMSALPSDLEWRSFDYNPGEVLAFHGYTIHDGAPNLSQEIRISLEIRFQSAHDPINEMLLKPNYRTEHSASPSVDWCFDTRAKIPANGNIVSNDENLAQASAPLSYYLN